MHFSGNFEAIDGTMSKIQVRRRSGRAERKVGTAKLKRTTISWGWYKCCFLGGHIHYIRAHLATAAVPANASLQLFSCLAVPNSDRKIQIERYKSCFRFKFFQLFNQLNLFTKLVFLVQHIIVQSFFVYHNIPR